MRPRKVILICKGRGGDGGLGALQGEKEVPIAGRASLPIRGSGVDERAHLPESVVRTLARLIRAARI